MKYNPNSNIPDWSNKVILIADDEITNLQVLNAAIKRTKAETMRVSNGEEAIEIFNENKDIIDLVLVDIKMPLKDGFEVLQHLRKAKPETVVIAQTAYALVDEEKEIRNQGFDDYISKPILSRKLFTLLDKYLK